MRPQALMGLPNCMRCLLRPIGNRTVDEAIAPQVFDPPLGDAPYANPFDPRAEDGTPAASAGLEAFQTPSGKLSHYVRESPWWAARAARQAQAARLSRAAVPVGRKTLRDPELLQSHQARPGRGNLLTPAQRRGGPAPFAVPSVWPLARSIPPRGRPGT